MPPFRKGIVVVEYDPSWPNSFVEIKHRLGKLLSPFVVEIAHVGSTSISGLCAKPKVDVDIVLGSDEAIALGTERLRQAGYTFHGNKYDDGMWAFTMGRGSFGERIYLCCPGNETHRTRIVFRDYLRSNPSEASAYGALKRRLAAEANGNWDYYTGSKGPFVNYIISRAHSEGYHSSVGVPSESKHQ
jgi:GrpB-like predicted nucleotidyltransferase (UPF0157 family)